MASDADWFDAWVIAHVKRLGLRTGKTSADTTHYLLDRRAVLIGQRGATASRLAAATDRCLGDTPAPRWPEQRFDAVCTHLKAVIADEVQAVAVAQVAPTTTAAGRPCPATALRCAREGRHNTARICLGEPQPLASKTLAELGRLYAAQGWHDLAAAVASGRQPPYEQAAVDEPPVGRGRDDSLRIFGGSPAPAPTADRDPPADGGDTSFDPAEFEREDAPS